MIQVRVNIMNELKNNFAKYFSKHCFIKTIFVLILF